MERGSDKHTPRVDENLKHDTRSLVQGAPVESRAAEEREQEGPADDEPTPDVRVTGGRVQDERQPTDGELEARSELARHLRPSIFPADRATLVETAAANNAPGWITDLLSGLPEGTYPTTESIWAALGGTVEHRA